LVRVVRVVRIGSVGRVVMMTVRVKAQTTNLIR